MTAMSYTLDFTDPASTQTRLVGGKASGLAVMTQAGIPVAPGFTVTTRAWGEHLERTGLRSRIAALLADADHGSLAALEQAELRIRDWFESVPTDSALQAAIIGAYQQLAAALGRLDLPVAVRSSATAEDGAGTSFAGEFETYVGIRGAAAVELHVRRCWASVFSARALCYAWKNGIDPLAVEMAVVIQKTVPARAAGVMFTVSPVTGDRSRLVLEASWGLGLAVVGGEVTPDRWIVNKVGCEVLECAISDKHLEYIDGMSATAVGEDRRRQACLSDGEVCALAQLGKRLERLQKAAQDIEFAIDRDLAGRSGDGVVLLQCRPVTVWGNRAALSTCSNPVLKQFASSVLAATHEA